MISPISVEEEKPNTMAPYSGNSVTEEASSSVTVTTTSDDDSGTGGRVVVVVVFVVVEVSSIVVDVVLIAVFVLVVANGVLALLPLDRIFSPNCCSTADGELKLLDSSARTPRSTVRFLVAGLNMPINRFRNQMPTVMQ